jgi:hypothetical protein
MAVRNQDRATPPSVARTLPPLLTVCQGLFDNAQRGWRHRFFNYNSSGLSLGFKGDRDRRCCIYCDVGPVGLVYDYGR